MAQPVISITYVADESKIFNKTLYILPTNIMNVTLFTDAQW